VDSAVFFLEFPLVSFAVEPEELLQAQEQEELLQPQQQEEQLQPQHQEELLEPQQQGEQLQPQQQEEVLLRAQQLLPCWLHRRCSYWPYYCCELLDRTNSLLKEIINMQLIF
jgi:hypothetical protein